MDAYQIIKALIPTIIGNIPSFSYYKGIYENAKSSKERDDIISALAIMFIDGGHQRLTEVCLLAMQQDAETDALAEKLGWKF